MSGTADLAQGGMVNRLGEPRVNPRLGLGLGLGLWLGLGLGLGLGIGLGLGVNPKIGSS